MKSLFDVLIEAVKRGLSLAVRDDRLSIIPDYLLTADFANLLRAHKPELLQLLTLPFVIVQSEVLNEIVVFVPDEETRDQLVSSGAKPGSIYTRAELAALMEGRTSEDELRLIHAAKQTFNGRITRHDD
jgi:hypothetical protein